MVVLCHGCTRRRLECDGRLALGEGQECYSVATPVTEQSSSGSSLLSSREEVPRQGDPNLGCPILYWPETARNYRTLKVTTTEW